MGYGEHRERYEEYRERNKQPKLEMIVTYDDGLFQKYIIDKIIESKDTGVTVRLEDKRIMYINLNKVLNIVFSDIEGGEKTNADKIRSMSDKELAEAFTYFNCNDADYNSCLPLIDVHKWGTREEIIDRNLKYLQSKV